MHSRWFKFILEQEEEAGKLYLHSGAIIPTACFKCRQSFTDWGGRQEAGNRHERKVQFV